MKFSALTLIPAASAFMITSPAVNTRSTAVRMMATVTRAAETEAIKSAMEASKKFGASSPEARVAWDAVEEINASDNSAATIPAADSECDVDAASASCLEYNERMAELQKLMMEHQPKIDQMKSLATDIQAIKVMATKSAPAASTPALKAALNAAKEAEAKYGKGSPEATVAWAELEDVASAGLDNAMGARLDEECLVDKAVEACTALEELNRAIAASTN